MKHAHVTTLVATATLCTAFAAAPQAERHKDLVTHFRSVAWEAFNRTDCGLKQIGTFRTRTSPEIASSKWSVGCETLDRDYADFEKYKRYVPLTGAKRGRLFSGWAKTEKAKGVYDFAWIEAQVKALAACGVKPWICLAYGNPVYGSGLNIGSGVAGVTENPEGFAAWLRYCAETVRRFKDCVDEWEVWNEPFGNQADAYSKMVMETSAAIRRVQPGAKVMVSAVGDLKAAARVLENMKKANRLDCVKYWHIHPYVPNPDNAADKWWGLDIVTNYRRMLTAANPAFEVIQGETGCPGQLEYTHAMCLRPWTEYSQAKWDLRNMAIHAVRGIPYSVFSMVDLQYPNMLQSYGLLRMDLRKEVAYVRPKFYACRNMFSFFDDAVKPVAPCTPAFAVLDARIPQADAPSCEKPKTQPVPYRVSAARFEKDGTPVVLAWYAHRIPSDALVFDTVSLTLPDVTFRDPVWMDMITGRVYEIPSGDFETRDGATVFARLPLWDSPVLLAERAQVPLR